MRYNASVSSLQTRFFPAARRFEDLTSLAEKLDEIETINTGLNLAPKAGNVLDEPKLINSDTLFSGVIQDGVPGWFVMRNGKEMDGPLSSEEFQALLQSDAIEDAALAKREGETQWVTVAELREKFKVSALGADSSNDASTGMRR